MRDSLSHSISKKIPSQLSIPLTTSPATSSKQPPPLFLHAHYRLTHSPHPDDAFYSGAWLFDPDSMPTWLLEELPPTPLSATMERKRIHQFEKQPSSFQCTRKKGSMDDLLGSGRWLFDPSCAPLWLQPHLTPPSPDELQEIHRAVNRATEDPLVTGIWLFHPEDTPAWLTRQLQSGSPSPTPSQKRKSKKKTSGGKSKREKKKK